MRYRGKDGTKNTGKEEKIVGEGKSERGTGVESSSFLVLSPFNEPTTRPSTKRRKESGPREHRRFFLCAFFVANLLRKRKDPLLKSHVVPFV